MGSLLSLSSVFYPDSVTESYHFFLPLPLSAAGFFAAGFFAGAAPGFSDLGLAAGFFAGFAVALGLAGFPSGFSASPFDFAAGAGGLAWAFLAGAVRFGCASGAGAGRSARGACGGASARGAVSAFGLGFLPSVRISVMRITE